jgi:glycosyltransferase involved in cell wall biosynthesis
MLPPLPTEPRISVIVPARNEEAVIGTCVESLAQQSEITEILVVNDQSTDRTAKIVGELIKQHPKVRLLETTDLPAGWVGKNHAVWLGANQAREAWLLFTDADVIHERGSGARALEISKAQSASLVSFSPEQITETWYEKSLIPVVYCRLASKFSFESVNDQANPAAAANGQFLMITGQAYDAVGGHSAVAGEVLEDVALATRVKEAGFRIWFGSGKGVVNARMYRSFAAMWEGWKKNLYRLIGGEPGAVTSEIVNAIVPMILLTFVVVLLWAGSGSWRVGLVTSAVAIALWHWMYAIELIRNRFAIILVWYGLPGKILYACVLFASFRSHQKGSLLWKGREYPVSTSGASKR